ncbi:MAG: metal ABC transporter solute-binding protein, Zn/Mn family, partial [Rothia aeria]
MPRNGLSRRAFLGFLPVCAALSACTAQNTSLGFDAEGRLQVVATTPILADVARAVGGERARVHALIPNGADPHSSEPSLRDVRDVAYARLAFTNGLLLEQRKMAAMVSSNLPQG